jgi:hypothetical protein
MKESNAMTREPPSWNPDAVSGTVLMEYLQRVSPQFVAAELDKLGVLDAADQAAAAVLERLAAHRPRREQLPRKIAAMLALAMCAMIVVIAQTRHLGLMNVLPENDGSHFMQLAGPTPEW